MKFIIQHWQAIVAFLGVIGIEISPIKINPIKWCLKAIGKAINSELEDKLDEVTEEVKTLKEELKEVKEDDDFKDIQSIKDKLSNYHVMLVQTGLDENQYRRCFELEDKYKFYKNKYNKDQPGRVNGHMDTLLATIHKNYENNNILDIQKYIDNRHKK